MSEDYEFDCVTCTDPQPQRFGLGQDELNDGQYDSSQDGIYRVPGGDFRPGVGYEWSCPLCDRSGWWVRTAKDLSWAIHGGGISVCRRCEKTRKDEIDAHNALFYGSKKKDPDCDHDWLEPYRGRFVCSKCGGSWNWMCGCGGSMYVCDQHYKQFMEANAPIERFLSANAR